MTHEPSTTPPAEREHHRECDQHEANEQHYPCSCAQIDRDLAEVAAEMDADRMREEGW